MLKGHDLVLQTYQINKITTPRIYMMLKKGFKGFMRFFRKSGGSGKLKISRAKLYEHSPSNVETCSTCQY